MIRGKERRRLSACLVLGVGAALIQTSTFADSSGRARYSGLRGATSVCTACHTAGAATPTVTLNGPATVDVGSVNHYTMTLTGGPAGAAGLDVAASNGTITDTNASGTQILNGELVHSSPNALGANNSITWTFDWQAPATAGTYTIYAAGLSADNDGTDKGDGTGTAMLDVTVAAAANQPPMATIIGPTTGTDGVAVSFDGSHSMDPDGTIAAYDWDFGDNTAGSGANVTHTYSAGTYTVTLTVTDNAGATASATASIDIAAAGSGQAPTANPGGPYMEAAGTAVQFDGSASNDPDGSIVSYDWDFGDGGTGTGVSPVHIYDAAGRYMVSLTVTDNDGMTGSATTVAGIATPAPTPTPTPTPGTGAGLYDQYCSSCHGPQGTGGSASAVVGASSRGIRSAISQVADMASLTNLTRNDIFAIAAYLNVQTGGGTPTPTPQPGTGTGSGLYDEFCAACHGPQGTGGSAQAVLGESAGDISEAINEVSAMASLAGQLNRNDLLAIAAFLNNGGSSSGQSGGDNGGTTTTSGTGEGLYDEYCGACHGPQGTGGSAQAVVGESAGDISEAINEVSAMAFLDGQLTSSDLSAIAAYLSNGTASSAHHEDDGEDDAGTNAASNTTASGTGKPKAQALDQNNNAFAADGSGAGSLFWLNLLLAGIWSIVRRRR